LDDQRARRRAASAAARARADVRRRGGHVEVNVKTGKVTVTKIHVVHDCGQFINPDGLRNQIEGDVVKTASRTLIEEATFDWRHVTSVDG
jgi:CO/xanthine dehydrogenase Mo-binding subunit